MALVDSIKVAADPVLRGRTNIAEKANGPLYCSGDFFGKNIDGNQSGQKYDQSADGKLKTSHGDKIYPTPAGWIERTAV